MKSFVSQFDLLKAPICFLYNGRSTISTNIGFVFSTILFLLLLNSALNSDFFYRTKPTISYQTDFLESFGRLAFDRQNFTIAVKIADFSGVSVIDYSYFYLTMSFTSLHTNKEIAIKNTKYMRICQDADFYGSDKALNLSGKSFCPSQEEPLILQGAISTTDVDYGVIHIYRCDQKSSKFYNVTCKSKEDIDLYMSKKFLYFYYTDNKFDLTNLENPIQRTLNSHLAYFYPSIKKTTLIPIQKTKIFTENGNFWVFGSEYDVQEIFSATEPSSDFNYDDSALYEYFLATHGATRKMNRSYLKLQDLLAILGGITNTYLLISSVFVSHYRKFLLIFEVFSHLYLVEKSVEGPSAEMKANTKKKRIKLCRPETSLKKSKSNKKMMTIKEKEIHNPTFNLNLESKEKEKEIPFSLFPKKQKTEKNPSHNNEIMTPKSSIPEESNKETKNSNSFKMMESVNKLANGPPRILITKLPSKHLLSDNSIPNFSEEDQEVKKPPDMSVLDRNQSLTEKGSELPLNKHIKYWEYVKFQMKKLLHMKFSKKEGYINKATKRFSTEMDVLKILEKLKELDKLKMILFDPVQQKMFEVLAKQKIQLNLDIASSLGNEILDESLKSRKSPRNKGKTATEIDFRLMNSLGTMKIEHTLIIMIPLESFPLEFSHSYIYENRYNMPKFQHGSLEYNLLVSNGFIKLFTMNGRAYWIAQMEQNYRVSDWKFHISVAREQVPLAWNVVAKVFMEFQCKSCMKCVFLKDPSSVAKGREITVYIFRYDSKYGEGLSYETKEGKVLFKLGKEMEQDGKFWFSFMRVCEERLRIAGVKIQGCANGDLKLGDFFSLRNESFVLHWKTNDLGQRIRDYEYPFDQDGWNKPGHRLPFRLPMKLAFKINKGKIAVLLISLTVFIFFSVQNHLFI